jgi:hypothetical protein
MDTPFLGYLVNVCEGELFSIDIDPSARIVFYKKGNKEGKSVRRGD